LSAILIWRNKKLRHDEELLDIKAGNSCAAE
jgi:hypothetical protein